VREIRTKKLLQRLLEVADDFPEFEPMLQYKSRGVSASFEASPEPRPAAAAARGRRAGRRGGPDLPTQDAVYAAIHESRLGLTLEEMAGMFGFRPRNALKPMLQELTGARRIKKVGRRFRSTAATVKRGGARKRAKRAGKRPANPMPRRRGKRPGKRPGRPPAAASGADRASAERAD
jgi:hypothetical protein